MATMQQYEEALALLMTYPQTLPGADEVNRAAITIYKSYQNSICSQLLSEARSAVAVQDYAAAASTLAQIDSESDCHEEAVRLSKQIGNEIKAQQPENEKLIQALSLIIDMLYNNPVYVNKLVVPELENLRQLVKLLTDADEVDITLADPTCECGCSGNSSKLSRVDSIYVKKGTSILEFKYAYAEAKQILESNHISTKWVALG